MVRDMRDWIELLRAHEELIEIKKEVDARDEMGSKVAIDATKPSLVDPEKRELFRRLTPKGWPKVRLKDYLS